MIGIYTITNTVNGKVYIGQAWDIERRWKEERGPAFHNKHLKASFKKYGIDNFNFAVLVELPETGDTQKILDDSEDYCIRFFNTMNLLKGYNKKGGGLVGGRHSKEARRKISEARKGKSFSVEHKKKLSESHKGRSLSVSHRRKISESNKGENNHNFGKRGKDSFHFKRLRSEETKSRMSGENNHNARAIRCIETGEVFSTVTGAGKKIGCAQSSISSVLHGRIKTAGKLHWEYADEPVVPTPVLAALSSLS